MLQRRLRAARRAYENKYRELGRGTLSETSEFFGLSERWLEAELILRDNKEDKIAAVKAHMNRTREIERIAIIYAKRGVGLQSDADAATYERLGAEIRYFQATGEVPASPRGIKELGSPSKEPPGEPLSDAQKAEEKAVIAELSAGSPLSLRLFADIEFELPALLTVAAETP